MIHLNFLITSLMGGFLEIFLMMLVAFLIGYGFGSYSLRVYKSKLATEGEKIPVSFNVTDIETNYTVIKPEHFNYVDTEITANPTKKKEKSNNNNINKENTLNFDRIGISSLEDKDDLTQIAGIGPFIEEKLNQIGIYTYEQISNFNDEDIKLVTKLIDFFPERISRDKWVEQANSLK